MRHSLQRALLPLALLAVFGSYAAMGGCKAVETEIIDDLVGAVKPTQEGTPISAVTPTQGAVGNVVTLPQGWTAATQQKWWYSTQGSEIVPYAFFLHLEQVDSEDSFRDDDHIASFRYLPQTATSLNPDALPVGFARTVDPQSGEAWMGFTCAACHTAQLAYGDQEIRIEGGPTLADYRGFQNALNAALEQTARDDAKFDRFARAVLGGDYSSGRAVGLRSELVEVVGNLERRQNIDASPLNDGYARVDALGQIFNSVTAYDLDIDANARPPDAPVSYPFVWGTAQTDFVQWNGSVSNANVGPVVRNVGELLGVFGHVDFVSDPGLSGYESSLDEPTIADLENYLEWLWSPQWTDAPLPAIDTDLAAQGREVYVSAGCQTCHVIIDGQDNDRRYAAVMTPYRTVGTDPKLVTNFDAWNAPDAVATGVIEGTKVGIIAGPEMGARTTGLNVLANGIAGVLLNHKAETIHTALQDWMLNLPSGTENVDAYKARPLTGIWATSPYLHNGSVPTLHDLLLPEDQRPASFWVGNRDFDPVKVGYVTTAGADGVGYTYDTSLDGNRNVGHTYGTTLSEADRMALIEYLKTL